MIGAAALDAERLSHLQQRDRRPALRRRRQRRRRGRAVRDPRPPGLALTAADFVVSGPANTAPAITSGATAIVAENSPASTIVYQTQANDADGDRITYSLSGADAGLLTIDANGAVRLIAPADFEAKSSYSFNVVASDSGSSTAKAVTLTITDVNETAATPIINETASANDDHAARRPSTAASLRIAANANLPMTTCPRRRSKAAISARSATRTSFRSRCRPGE